MVTFDIHKWFVSCNLPKFCQVVFNLKRKESLNTIHYLWNNKAVFKRGGFDDGTLTLTSGTRTRSTIQKK